MTLNPQQLHALAVSSKGAKDVRKQLESGHTYRIDCMVHLKGDLLVGHPSSYVSPSKASTQKLVELLLQEFGTRKRAAIVSKIVATLKAKPVKRKKGDPPLIAEEVTSEAARLILETTGQKKITKNGAVTGIITATIVEAP